jgi:hypothetical protein
MADAVNTLDGDSYYCIGQPNILYYGIVMPGAVKVKVGIAYAVYLLVVETLEGAIVEEE